MEKDIEYRIKRFLDECEDGNWYWDDGVDAIENLIKGYRKSEMENQSYKDYLGEPPCYDNAKYIPKSKIKEKIEELETKLKVFEKDIRYCKDRVQARLMNDEIYVLRRCMDLLKELMEDK